MSKLNYQAISILHQQLVDKKIKPQDLINESLDLSHQVQKKCNAFVTILDDAKAKISTSSNLLSNIPYGIKELISTKGILTTGSSNSLKDYVPFFNATVIEKLDQAGAIKINKTACDEFGLGGTGTTCHTGFVTNPWDRTKMCSGSSAGSAAAVAAGVYPFALGTDTGDSVRKPAAYCGIVGYKPTYGMISRYGIFPFASSLDHCGVFTRNVLDAAIVVDAIKGLDEKDMTTWDSSKINLQKTIGSKIPNKKLCFIKEICDIKEYDNASETLKQHLSNFKEVVKKIRENGFEVDEVSIDKKILKAVFPTYLIISCAEATSNLSNLTGLIFGPRGKGTTYKEVIKDHRTTGFHPLIKRRLVIGSYILQKENIDYFFKNAQRSRRVIVDTWKQLFKKYAAVILPIGSGPAKDFKPSSRVAETNLDILEEHLQIGNFGGFPSISIPDGFIEGLPVSLNITGNCYDDANVLNIAASIEALMPYKDQIAKEKQ